MTDTLARLIENSESPYCIYIFNNSLRDYVVLDGANSDDTVKSVTGFFCNKIWNREQGINIVRKLKKDPPPSSISINGTVPWKDVSRYIVNLYITVSEHRHKKHKDDENKKTVNSSVPENVLPFVCDEDGSNNCIKNFINEKLKQEKQKKIEEFEEITDQLSLEESEKPLIKPILKNKQSKKVIIKSPAKNTNDESSLSDSETVEPTKAINKKNINKKNIKNINSDDEDNTDESNDVSEKESEESEKESEESEESDEEPKKKANNKNTLNTNKREPIKKNQPAKKIAVNKTKAVALPIIKKKVK